MAYQNVGKPRFFIDNYQYLRALGLAGDDYTNEDDSLEEVYLKNPFNSPNAFNMTPEKDEDMSMGYRYFIPCGDQLAGMDFSNNIEIYKLLNLINNKINYGHFIISELKYPTFKNSIIVKNHKDIKFELLREVLNFAIIEKWKDNLIEL